MLDAITFVALVISSIVAAILVTTITIFAVMVVKSGTEKEFGSNNTHHRKK